MREAQRLGMVSTHYDNPNGLPDDGQITTARDLAVLARALWLDFPERRDLFGIPAIRAGKRMLRSQNALLERYRGANGMKTGFVCASGYNIVGSANRFGRQLMVVVLGATLVQEPRGDGRRRCSTRASATSSAGRSGRSWRVSRRRRRPAGRSTMRDQVCSSAAVRPMRRIRCWRASERVRRSIRASS